MDRNLLLAVALSIGVYALWFGVVEKKVSPPKPQASSTSAQPAASSQKAPEPQQSKAQAAPAPVAQPLPKEKLVEQAETFDFGNQKVRIHPRGAAIVSSLYRGPLGSVELVSDPRPGMFATFTDLTFKRDAKAEAPTFVAVRPDGVRVVKEFLPGDEEKLPRIRVRLQNPGRAPARSGAWQLSLGPGLGTVSSEQEENASVWRALGLRPADGGLSGKIEVFKKPGPAGGQFRWVGIDNRYFLAAVVPPREGFASVDASQPPLIVATVADAEVPAGGELAWELPYFLGAKGNNALVRYGVGLERAIDFGFFAQLGRLVLRALGYIHGYTHNWGWAIVILTLILQVVLFPLTYKSLKAAAAMKKLQPEIARLQQKYAKDPTRMNQEMMELYKRTGANPLGGCLPMLLQMPIFIALFNALRNSWELHGAVWMGWITDLSAKDPYYVLPVVMGGLMVLQQWMAPQTTADPTQAKIMMLMPVIFTFMFLKFPAGLVLYWLTNSLVSTASQVALKGHFERQT